MERKIRLSTLNNHITCEICGGYFIDATTVTECLHTCEFALSYLHQYLCMTLNCFLFGFSLQKLFSQTLGRE